MAASELTTSSTSPTNYFRRRSILGETGWAPSLCKRVLRRAVFAAKWIAASQRWIEVYSDEVLIGAAYQDNLMVNENRYFLMDIAIIDPPPTARDVPGYPDLIYNDLLTGVFHETLEVV